MVIKHCYYWKCHSDNRYTKRSEMNGVFFVKFPNPRKESLRFKQWMVLCGRAVELDFDYLNHIESQFKAWKNGSRFVCSKHFEGGKGPRNEKDDPIQSSIQGYKLNRKVTVLENQSQDPNQTDLVLIKQPSLTDKNCNHPTVTEPLLNLPPTLEVVDNQTELPENCFSLNDILKKLDCPIDDWFVTSKVENEITVSKIKGNYLVLNVVIGESLIPSIWVYGKKLGSNHKVFETLWTKIESIVQFKIYLRKLSRWYLCVGNHEDSIVTNLKREKFRSGFKNLMTNSLHSNKCSQITQTPSGRCLNCQKFRNILRKLVSRVKQEERLGNLDTTSRKMMMQLKKKPKKMIAQPATKTFGHRFIEEQIKMLNASSKFGRRWSLDMINWCATMEAAWPKAYQFLKVSGALKVPSKLTIFKSLKQQAGIISKNSKGKRKNIKASEVTRGVIQEHIEEEK